jgi:hypothetical protein
MPWALFRLPIAGTFTELVSGAAGTVVVLTGLCAGGARACAILLSLPQERVEWMTALGFVVGVAIALLIILVDVAWG